ncbi:MAG: peptidoglycan D,D-transpeptidase FtsI family protein [Lentihominibacter sp.]
MDIMKKNLKRILVMASVILLALVFRLAYIQVYGSDDLSAATRAQSMIALKGSNTRGMIYDRNGQPLVADSKKYIYIIKEDEFDVHAEKLLRKLSAEEVGSDNEGYRVYSSEHYNRSCGKSLIENNNAYILQASARYSDDQLAKHLIGYVNKEDNSGAAGLELMCDDQLSALNRRVYAVADVAGNILQGRGLVIASDENDDSIITKGIRTTIDKEIQSAVENIIEAESSPCAAVVMDVKTGGILAMACTPEYDQENIQQYLNDGGDELINKVTQGEYPPGSVFKIVTAAAALENGVDISRKYECSGSVKLGDIEIGCETGGEEGHGTIGLEEAFALSCNSFFVQLGMETGADNIISTAEKLGLGQKILKGFPQESSGHLMDAEQRYGTAIGNLSIGQGQTLTTPLQIAVMTNCIASGGINRDAHLLMSDEEENRQVISENTAEAIGGMMKAASLYGTASSLDLKTDTGDVKAAVKTGSAEYGISGENSSHGWITGYTPCDEPEFTITVFVENGGSGSLSAGPLFEKIIKYLEESGSYSRPTLA